MNYRTTQLQNRRGTDNQTVIASGDLGNGTVPAASLAAQPVLSSTGSPTLQTGITPRERGAFPFHFTTLQFTNFVISIPVTTGSTGYVGVEVYDFPIGILWMQKPHGKLTFTTTSTLSTTLNTATTTCAWSLGTVTASNVSLSSTMVDLIPSTTFTSSATINVVNTATTGILATAVVFDGSAAAKKAFFNVGVNTGGLSGTATVAVNGTIIIPWFYNGNYSLTDPLAGL